MSETKLRAREGSAVIAALDVSLKKEREFIRVAREEWSSEHLPSGMHVEVVGNGDRTWADHISPEVDGFYGSWSRTWAPDGKPKGMWYPPHYGDGKAADQRPVPPGWHFYVKAEKVRPHSSGRTPEAKAAVAALRELNSLAPTVGRSLLKAAFGIEGFGFGIEVVGEDVFVSPTWICPISENEHFEEVPMSVYWTIKEAHEASSQKES